jgi:hypothetical protein
MKIACTIFAVIFVLLGGVMSSIPEISGVGVYVIVGGVLIFFLGIFAGKTAKEKRETLAKIKSDDRLANAKIFEPIFDNIIAISESGFVGLKTDKMKGDIKVLNISDINGFEVNVNGNLQHNTGGAIAGGLLFGGIGAIIGGQNKEMITKLSFVFKTNDFNMPTIEIPLILLKVKKGSYEHQKALDTASEVGSLLELLERKYRK